MSLMKFENNQFIWSVFDSEEEEEAEDFEIKEIRVCDCFIDHVHFFIEKNNRLLSFRNFWMNFLYEIPNRYSILNIFVYYADTTIICCKDALYNPLHKEDTDKHKLDDDCLAEQIDFCCIHYLDRGLFFEFICDNCQKKIFKLVSKKRFITVKIK